MIRAFVLVRARRRCQACGRGAALEVHHVLKRSQGGSDFDLDRLVALCRACHERTDAACCRGRLVITPVGGGAFRFELVWRSSKREPAREIRIVCPREASGQFAHERQNTTECLPHDDRKDRDAPAG